MAVNRCFIRGNDAEGLRCVKEYIDAHYNEKLNTQTLSAMACMSATKFKCCFREAYGMTAFEYVRDVRVAEAIKLLEVKELPVAAIAKTVGYHKPRAFTKVFKDHTALLPKQYRNFLEGGAR